MTRLVIKKESESIPGNNSKEPILSWLKLIPADLRCMVEDAFLNCAADIEEIRLRIKRPILLRLGQVEVTIDSKGGLTADLTKGYVINGQDLDKAVSAVSQCSLYAWEDELRNGYITIPGGHRVGITGRTVLDKGRVKTIKDISGLNYRIGREIPGCADNILPYLIKEGKVLHTLIISPPQCGKTTLLRDIVRQLSDGVKRLRFPGMNVSLVDERSEIAGMFQGQPQFSVGMRTDVLDGCPKAHGMMMMIRAMSPAVIATDEIGRIDDMEAMYQALQAGVSVITTVHGGDYGEIEVRPVLKDLLDLKFFDRLVFLSRKKGVGTLDTILDGKTLERMR